MSIFGEPIQIEDIEQSKIECQECLLNYGRYLDEKRDNPFKPNTINVFIKDGHIIHPEREIIKSGEE